MANPFMVTSNQCYGMSLKEACEKNSFSRDGSDSTTQNESISPPSPSSATTHDVSFLYRQKESDRYGESAPYSDSSLSRVFRQSESDSMNKRRKNSSLVKNDSSANTPSKTLSKNNVREIVSNYNHNPKEQNPLYVTESNEFGRRKPQEATWTTKSHGLAQTFSRSFTSMYSDEGLQR